MNKFEIILDNGKYIYEYRDGVQTIFRNGEFWRDETGDNLLLAMAMQIKELEMQVDQPNTLVYEDVFGKVYK